MALSKNDPFATFRICLERGVFVSLWASVVFASINDSSAQPQITMEIDRVPTVCNAYHKALKDLTTSARVVSRNLLCERPISSVNEDFSVPQWESRQFILRDTGVLRKIDNFRWKRDTNPRLFVVASTRSSWKGTPKDIQEARRGYLSDRNARFIAGHLLADVDIDNDGISEPLYFDKACHSIYGSILLVLKDDLSDIDLKKTKPLLIHPDWKALRKQIADRQPKNARTDPAEESALANSFYGVFRHGGVTYFDYTWYPADLFDGKTSPKDVVTRIRVFANKNGNASEACRLKLNMYAD